MKFLHSLHWKQKRQKRPDIIDDLIEYAIMHSTIVRDKHWKDAFNAVCRVPPMGRTLKVVYRRIGIERIRIITAFWLD